jgi:hypothetical protein
LPFACLPFPGFGPSLGEVPGDVSDGEDGAVAGPEVTNFDVGEDPASGDVGTLAHPAASKAMADSAAT